MKQILLKMSTIRCPLIATTFTARGVAIDRKIVSVASLLAAALLFTPPSPAQGETSYHEYHGTIYGSDGSEARRYNGDTYIRQRNGREVRCHEFAGKTACQ